MQSILDIARERMRQNAIAGSETDTDPRGMPVSGGSRLTAEMNSRHRRNLLKKILQDSGYGDLARMVKIKEERV